MIQTIIKSVAILALLLTCTPTTALPVNDLDNAPPSPRSINVWMSLTPNGAVPCVSTNDPTKCNLRATQYMNGKVGAVFEVFDSGCKKIGADSVALGNHITINSELPWTIEMDVSKDWDTMPIGMYADHSVGQGQICRSSDGSVDVLISKSCLLPFDCK